MVAKKLPKTAADLRPADYNPRTITAARLGKLNRSLTTFGDLSGVVFNIRTNTLVSGHQRMKTLDGCKTRIVQTEFVDEFGTVAIGHVEAKTKEGIVKIPYRAVDWNIKREKAANVAANAHGGNFDKDKLALVLADIEDVKEFDIEVVGLDPLTLKSLRIKDDGSGGAANKAVEFKEYGEDLETTCTCPKCGYSW